MITLRINSACETMEFYRLPYGAGLRICQVELRFSSCVCVYRQEKMCPVNLYHRVYLVDRNFLVQKIYFLLLARNYKAQSSLAIKIEIYIG